MQHMPLGTIVGTRYRIERVLGEGGFGAVYKAVDVRLGNRYVAVKEMSQSDLSPEEISGAADAFQQEAHLLAGLMQPHLPRIYDHFSEGHSWYLVMDFIEGQTLEEKLEKAPGGKVPPEEAIAIAIQLCSVLEYLHTRQPPIIFRDLKPSNVMLTDEGHVYLIDFGIARHFKPGQTKDTHLFGSPGFAAPEQYGKAQTTPRSDIYSLGATLHQMLTGIDPSDKAFSFSPLPFASIPASAELDRLIQLMVDRMDYKRLASMAVVKQELQRITMLLASPSQPISAQPLVQPSPQPVVQPSVPPLVQPSVPPVAKSATPLQGQFCSNCGSLNGSRNKFCSRCGANLTEPVEPKTATSTPPKVASPHTKLLAKPPPVTHSLPTAYFTAHAGTVTAVAFRRVGWTLASGSTDMTLKVWNVAGVSGQRGGTQLASGPPLLCHLTGHKQAVMSVAFSPDGRLLASGSRDKSARVWVVNSATQLYLLAGHAQAVGSVAFSPLGGILASGSWDAAIRLWDVTSGTQLRLLKDYTESAVTSLAFSPDGSILASGSWDNSIKLWDVESGAQLRLIAGHSNSVTVIAFSPDGGTLASGSEDKTIRLWDVSSGTEKRTLVSHTDYVKALAFSPDGRTLASGSEDTTVRLWNVASGTEQYVLADHNDMVESVAYSPDGHILASGARDGVIRLWML